MYPNRSCRVGLRRQRALLEQEVTQTEFSASNLQCQLHDVLSSLSRRNCASVNCGIFNWARFESIVTANAPTQPYFLARLKLTACPDSDISAGFLLAGRNLCLDAHRFIEKSSPRSASQFVIYAARQYLSPCIVNIRELAFSSFIVSLAWSCNITSTIYLSHASVANIHDKQSVRILCRRA